MSTRILSHSAVRLSLLAMAILASVGQATDRSEGRSVRRYSYADTSWPRRPFGSERRDLAPSEQRYFSDPELLFQRLDDMEQKLGIPEKMAAAGKVKSEHYLVGPTNVAAQLLKDNLYKFPIDDGAIGQGMHDDCLGKEDVDDPFESLARMNFNEHLNERKSDRELKRVLGGYLNDQQLDGKPAVATANLLAKVISSKVDQPRKSGPCRGTTARSHGFTTRSPTTHRTTLSTTTRSPTTFCLPEPSSDPPLKPLPTSPPTPRPPPSAPSRPPTTRKPSAQRIKPSNKCPISTKSQKLGGAKVLLEIILATKQHALSVLKNLNYLELELLSHSTDDDVSENHVKEKEPTTKTSERIEKPEPRPPSRVFSFGIRPASQKESLYDLAVAKEEELKLQDRVWEEHQQQMKLRRPVKPKRFEVAPAAAARLEPFQEPRKPLKSINSMEPFTPLEPETSDDNRRINLEALSVVVKPMSSFPRKDSLSSSPRAQMNAVQLEGTSDDELHPGNTFELRPRKKKKHKLYAMEKQTQTKKLPIAGVFY